MADVDLTDDALAGDFCILQRRRGHRYSLDDVATAWEAARAVPSAARYLDLGCGIGSVLLMVAYKLPGARVAGIEAQAESFALAARNAARCGQADRVTLVHGDLRDGETRARAMLDGPFDLITGTPPYMPPENGTVSPDPQRAHARAELRGGVEAYLAAAAEMLAPGGRAVVCADARRPDRVLGVAPAVGLAVVRRRDVIPRAGTKGALFTVWTLALADEIGTARALGRVPPLIARDEHGARTEQAHALRRFFDLPVNEAEAASP